MRNQGLMGLRMLLLGSALLLSACDSAPKAGTSPPTTPGAVIPKVSVADASAAQTADARLQFAVTLSEPTSNTVQVNYDTVDGTAQAGSDYVAQLNRVLVFHPGEVTKIVSVQPVANSAATGDRALTLQLSAPLNATLDRAVGAGTLKYALPQAVVADASTPEGDIGGSNKLMFAVTLDKAAASAITIDYSTSNGTAMAGTDYVATSGTLGFAVGETTKSIEVPVIGNEDVQSDRALTLTLSGASGATLKRAQARGTIVDDDHARQINIDDASAYRADGHLTFKLTLDSASARSISVHYATQDGTAKAGTDYVASTGDVTFAAGVLEQTIVVNTINNGSTAGTLNFKVLLSAPVNAVLASGANEANGSTLNNTPPAAGNIDLQILPDVLTADRCDFFDNHYCLFPWPNDYFTTTDSSTDTGRRVNLNILSMPRNIAGKPIDPTEWNHNDGFSPGQAILVRIPNLNTAKTGAVPITNIGDSMRDSQPIVVLDADTGERHLIWSELDANLTKFTACDAIRPIDAALGIAGDAGLPAAEQIKDLGDQLRAQCKKLLPQIEIPLFDPGPALIIRPAINFKEGHRYIVALRNLKDGSGNTITAPPSFQIYRDNHSSLLPQVNNRRAHMEQLFAKLAAAGIQRNTLYMAWDFTVASKRNLSERVLHIRDDSLAALGDNTPGSGVDGNAPSISKVTVVDNVSSTIAREVRGVITVPSYLNLPNGIAGSRFYYPPGSKLPGRNPVTPTQTFDFLCRIPYTAFGIGKGADTSTAMAAVPARPALYGHGLLGSKSEGSGQIGDMIQENNFIYCATDWIGMASHDTSILSGQLDTTYYDPPFGDVLNVLTILTDVSNFPTLADRVQQSLINFTYLGRAVINPRGFCALDAFKINDKCMIDTRELFYDGNSQGGIIGGALVAISPDIKAGVLGVPGMNYSTLLQRSVDFDMYASLLYTSYPGSLDQQFVLSFMQMLWDRAENDGYAQHLNATDPYANTPPKRVLLTPAFGDHQVSMYTAEVMARTIGAKVHCYAVVSGSDAQKGPAVKPGANPAVLAEQAARPDISFGRRHPDDKPYDGIPCIDGESPYVGNALSVWDSGPIVNADGSSNPNGVAPPPVNNTPPRPELGYGADPHEFPRSTFADRATKSDFLKTQGGFVDHCNGQPCTTRGFNSAP
ncbi:MAG: hypothetical protein E6Q40_12255 [Cupriavidus sp.]|nr:MAG: hypothetical protein E6Q40_12255 [Cupriavidus sp.]